MSILLNLSKLLIISRQRSRFEILLKKACLQCWNDNMILLSAMKNYKTFKTKTKS